MRTVLLLLTVIALYSGCVKNPTELNGQKVGDCGNPTLPSKLQPDATNAVVVIEVYDFRQKLAGYTEVSEPFDMPQFESCDDTCLIYFAALYQAAMFPEGVEYHGVYITKVTVVYGGMAIFLCYECNL